MHVWAYSDNFTKPNKKVQEKNLKTPKILKNPKT